MRPVQRYLFYCAALAFILACGLPAPADQVSLATVTPEITSTVDGTPFDIPPLAGILTFGMGTGVSHIITTEIEFPYINGSFGDMPLHTRYQIEEYPVGDTILSPSISIFSAAEYAAYSDLNQQAIFQLSRLNSGADPAEVMGELMGNGFDLRAEVIHFENGMGVRCLTQPQQTPGPINNRELLYFFQGMTSNGQYFISAVLPVSAPQLLAASGDPNTTFPPSAIPFDRENFETHAGYYEAVQAQLESAGPDDFLPSLTQLDQFMQSFKTAP